MCRQISPFKRQISEMDLKTRLKNRWPEPRNRATLTDGVRRHKCNIGLTIFGGAHKPASYIIKRVITINFAFEDVVQIRFLFFCTVTKPQIRRIPTNIGLAALILEVDGGLFDGLDK